MRLFIAALFIFINLSGAFANDTWMTRQREWLAGRLIADGLDSAVVKKIMFDPRLTFHKRVSKINMKHTEDSSAYKSFLLKKNIRIARRFLKKHNKFLTKTENEMGVPKEMITAILLIETKCGQYKAKVDVPSVLFSIAVSSSSWLVDENFKELKKTYPNLKRGKIAKRSVSRSRYAYKQLRAFIKGVVPNTKKDAYKINGSWAGAFGIPQFIPQSYNSFAVDGNKNGVIELFNKEDTIASVANYFKKNGWKNGKSQKKLERAVWSYNRSDLYVKTAFAIMEKLKS